MTGTLFQLADRLQQQASQLQETKQQQTLYEHLTTRRYALQTTSNTVRNIRTSVEATDKLLKLESKVRTSCVTQATTVSSIHQQYQGDPKFILGNDLPNALRVIDQVMVNTQVSLKEQWRSHLQTLMPSLPEVVLNVLAADPRQAQAVQSVRSIIKQLSTLQGQFPITDVQVRELKRIKMAIQSVQKVLQNADVPDSVVEFLTECAAGGASIAKLTPEVQRWLQQHGVTHAFTITIKRT